MRSSLNYIARRFVAVALLVLGSASVGAAATIQVAWDPSPDAVSGYVVYVGSQPGVYGAAYDVGGALSLAFSGAVAGQPYYFAVASYTSGPVLGPLSAEIVGYSDAPPIVTNPGNQVSAQGVSVSLQIAGADPLGQPVSFSATGLPPGLQISSSGRVTGSGSTAGVYSVNALVSDGALTASTAFSWTITQSVVMPLDSVGDTTAPAIVITTPGPSGTHSSTTPLMTIRGTASDNVGVTRVSWAVERGASGDATGTTTWTASVPLNNGNNRVTVTARDAAGNVKSATITVQYKSGGNGRS